MRRMFRTDQNERDSAFRYACRGSFTVEASFLYPILVFLIVFLLTLSMSWQENVRAAAEDTEELTELDLRSEFLKGWGQFSDR